MENDLQSISTRQISNINIENKKTVQQAQKATPNQVTLETMTFDDLCSTFDNVKDSLQQEQAILKTAKDEFQRVKKNLEKEHSFIQE
eukprot:8107698-Ditylum_brightwellii.AAC.1